MNLDSSQPRKPARRPNRWVLPAVLEALLRQTKLDFPLYLPGGRVIDPGEPVNEVSARLDGEVPARALAPELVIGDVRLTESVTPEKHLIVFHAPLDMELEPGAPVRLAWQHQPASDNAAAARLTTDDD